MYVGLTDEEKLIDAEVNQYQDVDQSALFKKTKTKQKKPKTNGLRASQSWGCRLQGGTRKTRSNHSECVIGIGINRKEH